MAVAEAVASAVTRVPRCSKDEVVVLVQWPNSFTSRAENCHYL